MSSDMTIRVVAFKEGDHVVAQALEVDVCAQGCTLDEAHKRLLMTIKSEAADALAEGRTLMDIGPAPHPFHLSFRDEDIERTELKVS